jgi:ABC-type transport system involved in multi-copper enzyme maturation permease subunit
MSEHGCRPGGLSPGFNMLPVAQKELIDLAGLRRTYVVRVAFASALMVGLFAAVNVVHAWNPANLIGVGRIVFGNLVFWLFAAVLLLLPGMVAGAFPRERYHGTLALLILTGLPPWRIVTEKMLGRLVPMGTLIAAALPVLAIAYALGGVTLAQLVTTSYLLAVTCLQVGAFAIMVSVVTRTARGAVLRAYGAGLIFVAGVLIVSIPIWLPLEGRGIPVAPILALLRARETGTFAGLVLESVPSLIVAVLCLWNAAAGLGPAWQALEMMSPAAMLLWLERGAGPLNPWWLIAINFTAYGLLLHHLRRRCLRLAGVWLGRVEAQAA